MRELKFRIWDKADQEWTSYPPVFSSAHGKIFEFFPSKYQAVNLVIQQYTGLKDKNGKEIYEGDILRSPEGFIREVIWYENDSAWRLRENSGNVTTSFKGWIFENVVVGNIFQNSELLKQ